MNTHKGSIYRISECTPGTEGGDMLERFPHAGHHDSNNYIFAASHPNAVAALEADDEVDGNGNPLSGDAFVDAVAKEMAKAVRGRGIHLSKNSARTLHAHPLWRVWRNAYEDNDDPIKASDWAHVEIMHPGMPTFVKSRTRGDIEAALLTELRK